MRSFTLQVPATTANLGPGFDSFGCAFRLYNVFTFTQIAEGLEFENVKPEFATPDNLTVRSYHRALELFGLPPVEGGLRLRIDTGIPISSGLGSSASLIVAGVMAAGLMHGRELSREEILLAANDIEGHPDNVAPAIYGDMTVAMLSEGIPLAVKYEVSPALNFIALIPDFELNTKAARAALPKSVSLGDAVFNLSHGAMLIKALQTADTHLIGHALRDRLHQPYRMGLIPDYEILREEAMAAGCCAFCISGAGPTCMSLTTGRDTAERVAAALAARGDLAAHWRVLSLPVDHRGAAVLSR